MSLLIQFLVLLFCVSCSTMQYGVLYSADTMKKSKCDPIPYQESIIETIFTTYTDEDMKKAEAQSGYSECKAFAPSEDSRLTECQKPILYKAFISKKKAECDKFMVDNKLLN
jgi:uncharacterized protein YfaA (DUF2138 family)